MSIYRSSLSPHSICAAIPAIRAALLEDIAFFHAYRFDDGVMGCIAESAEERVRLFLRDLDGLASAW